MTPIINRKKQPETKPILTRSGTVTRPAASAPGAELKAAVEKKNKEEHAKAVSDSAVSAIRGIGSGRHVTADDGDGADSESGSDPAMDELVKRQQEHEAERKAAEEELKAGKAKALQDVDARAGLGGFGLSGATGALKGDVSRVQDRNAVLALSDLQRKQEDQDFQDIQRTATLDDLEAADDRDYNNDGLIAGQKAGGKIGDGDPENDPAQSGSDLRDQTRAIVEGIGGTGKDNDPYGGIGGASEAVLSALVEAGVTFSQVRAETGAVNGEKYVYCKGSDGNWYKFKIGGSGWGNTPSDDDALQWFARMTG